MRREHAGGFTLVEMMIVVVIFGILASLAVVGMRKYIQHSKTAEATQMIGAIKAGQEAYFDETFRYLDVSGGDLDNRYPLNADWDLKVQWGAGDATLRNGFATLGVSTAQAVQYRYSTVAGTPADGAPSFGDGVTGSEYNFPGAPTVPWYVVKAIADLDQDGTYGVYLGSNFSNEIFAKNDDE